MWANHRRRSLVRLEALTRLSGRSFKVLAVLAALGLPLLDLAAEQLSSPVRVPSVSASDVLPALLVLKLSTAAGLPPPYIVEGNRSFDRGNVLAAEEIVLAPGSHLTLSGSYGDRREKYIVAKRITILPGSPPPVIAWQRPDPYATLPPAVGKAQSGSFGAQEGALGGPGADGAPGNPGFPGADGPAIYLAVNEINGGTLYVDLRGQDGGPGGIGQAGGDGGRGAPGAPSTFTILDACSRNAQSGGNGGAGGKGGSGGTGGRGGDGGTLVLLAAESALPKLASVIRSDTQPGLGGPGGKGGAGGAGGGGGGGGAGSGICGGGQGGQPGPRGADGSDVPNRGPSGQAGVAVSVPVNQTMLNAIGLQP
jgi:hypothetical protein